MTNRHKIKYMHPLNMLCLWLLATGIIIGFHSVTVQHTYHSFPNETWNGQDTIDFPIEVTDSLADYLLTIEIRNNNHYPYQDLPLSITCTEGDSLFLRTDTLSIRLADSNGNWTGNGLGGLYQSGHPAGYLRPRHTGIHHIRMTYLLPDTMLAGISNIGIRLETNASYHAPHQHAGK